MTDNEINHAAQSLRRTGRGFLIVVILLGLGLLFNGYQTLDLEADTRAQIRETQIQSCERTNERVREQNRRLRTQRVALDTSVVVAGLSAPAYERLGIPPTVEAERLLALTADEIRRMRKRLRLLPVVDCQRAFPPLG